MGKLRDIPVLKAALAERTLRLRDGRAGVSDAAAALMGLVTPDEHDLHHVQPGQRTRADLMTPAAMSYGVGMSDKAFDDAIKGQYPVHGKARNTPEEALITQFGNENAALRDDNDRLNAEVASLRERMRKAKDDLRRRTTRFNPATMCEEPWDPVAVLDEIRAQIPRDRRLECYTTAGAVEHMARLLAAAEARLSGLPANADPAECAALLGLQAVRVEPGMLLAIREPGPNGSVPLDALKRMGRALHSELAKRFGSMTYGAPVVLCIPHGATLETVLPQGRGAVQVNVQPEGHPKKPTDVPKDVARIYAVAAADSFGVTPEVVRRKRSERRAAEAVRLGLGPAPVEVGQYLRFRSLLARVESVYVRRDYRCWYIDLALCDADGMPLPTEGDAVSGISGPASELLTQFVTKVSAPIPRGERRPIGTLIGWEDPDDLLLADAPDAEG